jgi:hypothetical protein
MIMLWCFCCKVRGGGGFLFCYFYVFMYSIFKALNEADSYRYELPFVDFMKGIL